MQSSKVTKGEPSPSVYVCCVLWQCRLFGGNVVLCWNVKNQRSSVQLTVLKSKLNKNNNQEFKVQVLEFLRWEIY
jgi:hypothetical protein